MEAKDIVIDIAEDKYDGLGADTLVEIQAKEAFKAGYEEGQKHKEPVYDFGRRQYEAGIREVVEWVEKGGLGQHGWGQDFRTKWQSQLKEWGVE